MMLKPWKLAAGAATILILTVVMPNQAQPNAAQGQAAQAPAVVPFKAHIPGEVLVELRRRLAQAKWPDQLGHNLGARRQDPLEKERNMTTENSKALNAAQIRKLMDDRVNAVRTKDVNASMSNLAPDIVSFDVVNPLQKIGLDSTRIRAEDWFSSFQGPIGYEIRDLSITAGDDVSFSHGLSHVSATRTDGGQLDMWWRATVCFRKTDGKWMVTHEHNSVPFDVESGKASLDLKP